MNDMPKAPTVVLPAPAWSSSGATIVRGSGHVGDAYLTAAELARHLDACTTDEMWRGEASRVNGCFAAVTAREGRLLAAVDRIRSIPLFFAEGGGVRMLADSAVTLRSALGDVRVDEVAASEFFLTGYVTGAQTLFQQIRQIPAGHILRWDWSRGGQPQLEAYYTFAHGDFVDDSTPRLIERLERVHERLFARLLRSVDGRQLVVPLSGGYDSRLIGVSLRDLGARDVVCYTYGVPGNWEARISRELAAYLGFRWEFVPYSAERWAAWSRTGEFRSYLERSGNLASTPHVQDWPAVFELDRARTISPEAVFSPGHSGDFLAGSHVPKDFILKKHVRRGEILGALLRSHYSLWDWPARDHDAMLATFAAKIESIAGRIEDCPPERAADLFERWDLKERQAKFICNSVRVYEDRGHAWRLPLFDHELMDFWSHIPVELRTGRRLYFDFVAARQQLPVTQANQDHGALFQLAVQAMDALRLRPMGRRIRRYLRKWQWEQQYGASSLAWYSLVNRDYFRRTYTGSEIFHAYMARAYLDSVRGDYGTQSAARAIGALAPA